MDIDADGNSDLITGCFEGGLYLIKGLGKSESGEAEFSKPEKIMDSDGNILRLGQYWDDDAAEWTGVEGSEFKEYLGISGHAVDFDDDGDFDLLIGSNEGYLFLRENVGTASEPEFATESTRLMATTSKDEEEPDPLFTGDGHALPVVFDWDADGMFDIITGRNDGSVMWARNVGVKGEPKFDQLAVLIESGQEDADGIAVGQRSQVAVGDFDDDGNLDVIVGDYNTVVLEKVEEQSEEDKKALEKVKEELSASSTRRMELMAILKTLEESEEADAEDELKTRQKELEECQAEFSEIIKRYQKLAPKTEMHGFVWLFKGKGKSGE